MNQFSLPQYCTEHVNGVTVFRILVKEVCGADRAVAVFRGVSAMARRIVPAFIADFRGRKNNQPFYDCQG
jgi:hypothetical protein